MKQEYISIKKLAIKYDIHPDTIRKKDLIQGVHYIKIGKLIRYNVSAMHDILTAGTTPAAFNIDKFLIDTVE